MINMVMMAEIGFKANFNSIATVRRDALDAETNYGQSRSSIILCEEKWSQTIINTILKSLIS